MADNDAVPSARDRVGAIAAAHPLPITYLHAPEANISVARNALLDHARATGARLLVYLDDDETVEPAWLSRLVAAWRAGQQAAPKAGSVSWARAWSIQPGAPGL